MYEVETHIFRDWREFYHNYPSRFYTCSNCGYMNFDMFTCQKCGWRADGLLKTMGKGYKIKILSANKTLEIFKPIELEKGENNGK